MTDAVDETSRDDGVHPDRHAVTQRFADLAPDGSTTTRALARYCEQARLSLHFPRFEKLRTEDDVAAFRFMFVAHRVVRSAAFGRTGTKVRIGTGIHRIGRSSFTFGHTLSVDGLHLGSVEATAVVVGENGPLVVPDSLRSDLEELRLPGSEHFPGTRPDAPASTRIHYTSWVSVDARVTDVDLNRHVNYIAIFAWYEDAVASSLHAAFGDAVAAQLPDLAPQSLTINYLGEVFHPGRYDLGVAVSDFDEHVVHYSLGIFTADRCLGTAEATAPRGDLPVAGLTGLMRHR